MSWMSTLQREIPGMNIHNLSQGIPKSRCSNGSIHPGSISSTPMPRRVARLATFHAATNSGVLREITDP